MTTRYRGSDLTSSGHLRLMELLTASLTDGTPLRAANLAADPDITAKDLRFAVKAAAGVLGPDATDVGDASKDALAAELCRIVEVVTGLPEQQQRVDMYSESIHFAGPRKLERAGGPSGKLTERYLRDLRHANGWVALTPLLNESIGHTVDINKALPHMQELRHRKIEEYMNGGLKQEEAERKVQQEYIAITPRKKLTWYDLSPEAAADVESRYRSYHRPSLSLTYFVNRYQLPVNGHRYIAPIVQAIQQRAVERRAEETGCSRDEATAYVGENYIRIGAQYWISPDAQPEIDAAIQERFPGRKPVDVPANGHQRR